MVFDRLRYAVRLGYVKWVEWHLIGRRALDHTDAVSACPQGYRAPTEEELENLVQSAEVRGRFPQLFQGDAAVWSDKKVDLQEKWFAVNLATGSSNPRIFDYPAWALVRKRTK